MTQGQPEGQRLPPATTGAGDRAGEGTDAAMLGRRPPPHDWETDAAWGLGVASRVGNEVKGQVVSIRVAVTGTCVPWRPFAGSLEL